MLFDFYQTMIRIRYFELKLTEYFTKGMLYGNIHTSIGQEAVAAGANKALEKTDFITATHRGHGQIIAKGADTKIMMAELFGKSTGYCKGKGGSMHVADVSLGILGANGIVGAGIPIAVGSALASKIKGTNEVSMAIFGDAASNQGVFHEAVNMSAAWKLPVVFLCENNSYGVSVNIHTVTNTDTIAERAKAYNIPGVTVDGNDPIAVYEEVKKAVEYARKGNGPSIVECMTWRVRGHYEGDRALYRSKEVEEGWSKKDPIDNFRNHLLKEGIEEHEIVSIEEITKKEIDDAIQFALDSPLPDYSEVTTDVYSDDNGRCVAR
ncbi:thiamine pyrophosphate-dependent dehydrogenase E1 component subunit alpha [Sedimentibacter hydroxybenzoicus DSM 7310]|uniref:Thiamine pyrophosphate-dependent dehydrogenase E1 component subunit alpha n=1 Tax=Sedimentibacter hydroxybenzoicus DSM 7310 TaxID=1123245 RepID=A0A974BL07_SEDHY|nr:thiamine pyrophosphate-dependent dehydrogenase E1 component subunit alpha [Sedimentibacter hydroxybenzoicus DSM 7310]